MLAVVGLGNWQEKYWSTRHNFGARVVDRLGQNYSSTSWQKSQRLGCLLFKTADFILAKPQTAMNNSGLAVKKLVNFYKINCRNLLIVHDDLDLSLGNLKLNIDQSAAGHHGVESVISNLGTEDFWRLRLGIGHPKLAGENEVIDFVLKKFSPDEKLRASSVIDLAVKLIIKGIGLSAWEPLRGGYEI